MKIEVERTFAGKQYENLKPKAVLEYDSEDEAPDVAAIMADLIIPIEEVGKKWKEEQLGLK